MKDVTFYDKNMCNMNVRITSE